MASPGESWTTTRCGSRCMNQRTYLHLWSQQPPVADAALDELLKARHKCTNLFHVVVVPRLMALQWQRLFNMACNFTFVVSPVSSFWPSGMFEPLWVGILLPFTPHRPWCFNRAPLLVKLRKKLQELLKTREEDAGDLLWKLLKLLGRVGSILQRVACRVLHIPRTDACQHSKCPQLKTSWETPGTRKPSDKGD
jgi:hypothetical protein